MSIADGEPRYDLFISYAHRDNDGEHNGKVTALKEWIETEYQRITSRKLEVFFDVLEIRSMDDWQQRILVGLQQSRVMLAVLSPNYFTSAYCRKEWEEYLDQELAHALPGEGIAPIYVLKHPAFEEYDVKSPLDRWLQNLKRRQWVNCVEWWPEGQRALEREGVRKQLAEVNERIVQRLDRARRRDKSPTNLPRYNKKFVGRTDELYQIREQLIRGHVGALTAVNGIGGIGKSALALVYGYAYGHEYPGGRFWIPAAGLNDLRGALIALAPKKGVRLTQEELQRPDYAFEKVKTAFEQGPPALLVLDNVDDPDLLDPARRDAYLPSGDHTHVLATTRLDPRELHEVECVPLDALPPEAALDLLGRYRPISDTLQDDEWKAALEIVNRLGGHALAVEVVAVYLSRHPEISYREYLTMLEREGITLVETTGADKFVRLSRHVERSIGRLLAPTLESLTPAELAAVQWAALLPADHVPLPWIEDFLCEDFPELVSQSDLPDGETIQSLLAHLEGLRLLVPADDPRIRRMHRIVQAVVADRLSKEDREPIENRICGHAFNRAGSLENKWHPDCVWEVAPLHAFVLPQLQQETRPIAAMAGQVATALLRLGRWFEGRELMGHFATITKNRAAQYPYDVRAQRDWFASLIKMGDLSLQQGTPAVAWRQYQQALDIFEQSARTLSDYVDVDSHRDCSVALERLGDLSLLEGRPDIARRCFNLALDIRKRLVRALSNNVEVDDVLALGVPLQRLGNLSLREEKHDEAQRYLVEYLKILEPLASALPGNVDAQRAWSVWLNEMYNLMLQEGRPDEARRYFAHSLAIRKRLARTLPQDVDRQLDFSDSLEFLGNLRLQDARPDRARRYFQMALNIREKLVQTLPDDEGAHRRLAESWHQFANLAGACGNGNEFTHCLAKCRQQLRSMRDRKMHLDPEARQLLDHLESFDLPDDG